MSTEINQEVQRITSATNDIANAITSKGGTSPTGGIDTFSAAVQSIPSGGGTVLPESTTEWVVKTGRTHPVLGYEYELVARYSMGVTTSANNWLFTHNLQNDLTDAEVIKVETVLSHPTISMKQPLPYLGGGYISEGLMTNFIEQTALSNGNQLVTVKRGSAYASRIYGATTTILFFDTTDRTPASYAQLMSLGIQPEGDEANQINQLEQIGVK